MRTYTKDFNCSLEFPVKKGERWDVKERNHLAETWEVIAAGKGWFKCRITEHFPPNGAPRG